MLGIYNHVHSNKNSHIYYIPNIHKYTVIYPYNKIQERLLTVIYHILIINDHQ